MKDGQAPDVSICMVSLNCWHVLEDCLDSIRQNCNDVTYEIIIVDNASTDQTAQLIARGYPEVTLIRNTQNVGFSRGTNQGIQRATGRYILWLNTDTIVHPAAISTLIRFLDQHPRTGIVGPKLLNADGSFQAQCRRGMPTPKAAFRYMLGLDKRRQSEDAYLLSHLPIDEPTKVAAVSGACLLARREVIADIGMIDETYFGFGEDLDWCVKAAAAGWDVCYEPASVVVHLKGQGGAHAMPYHKIYGIHQAMWLFYSTHLRRTSSLLMTAAVATGISVSFAGSMVKAWIRRQSFGARRGKLKVQPTEAAAR